MLVLGINKINKCCRITSGGRSYMCPIKEVDGKLSFLFKKAWHPVADYIQGTIMELVQDGGKTISRPFSS